MGNLYSRVEDAINRHDLAGVESISAVAVSEYGYREILESLDPLQGEFIDPNEALRDLEEIWGVDLVISKKFGAQEFKLFVSPF